MPMYYQEISHIKQQNAAQNKVKKLVQSRHDLTIDQIKNMLQTQQFRTCMSIQNSVISLPCQGNTDKIYHLAEQSLIYPYR